jgi:hypothetical protein
LNDYQKLLNNGLHNGNIDTYINKSDQGYHWIQHDNSLGNQPGFEFYFLSVLYCGFSGSCIQIAIQITGRHIKERMYVNSIWNEWFTII